MEQKYIITISPHETYYYTNCLSILCYLDPVFFNPFTIDSIYEETIRQIFDCLTEDFIIFQDCLQTKPDFHLFLGNTYFENNPSIRDLFKKGIISLGTAVYFNLMDWPFYRGCSACILNFVKNDALGFTIFSEDTM
jgi:hypothetical protein